ncbi:MAG TPA: RluA family pseudouridine synthase [Gammaproteobacteria bacterium]|nr:RluA family pseudouridine synthase [Gammaproteobacteria bacterium]
MLLEVLHGFRAGQKGEDCTPISNALNGVKCSGGNFSCFRPEGSVSKHAEDSAGNLFSADSSKVQFQKVSQAQDGQRLDNFLIRRLKGVPRSRIYRIIRRGEVRVNKKRCKPEYKLKCDDEVRIPPFFGSAEPKLGKPSPGLQNLLSSSVLYEDEQLLVINKPAGLAVHGGTGIRLGLIEALRQMRPEWSETELAHRLDRDTSGCLVIAKNSRFLKHIQNELKLRNVNKHYLALVHGQWPGRLDIINAALRKREISVGERIVTVDAAGKPSITRFKLGQRFAHATLLEVMPETGRTHQIRVHCQHAGHPIVGDAKYTCRGADKSLSGIKNLCLHAWKIEFSVPDSKRLIQVQASVDKSMQGLIDSL